MMNIEKRIANGVALGIGGLLLAACATPTPPPELVQARRSYELAAANPTIIEHAPVDLFEASKSVDRAEAAFKAEADTKEVSHLAFLAIKRVEIADAGGRSRAAQKEVLRLKQLRERTRYEARAQEAAQSAREAAQARAQVDSLVAAARFGTPSRNTQDDSAVYEALLAQRELELSATSVERRLRELEATRAAEQTQAEAERMAQEAARTQALEAGRQDDLADQQRAIELLAANEAAEERLRELAESVAAAELQALELDAARESLTAASAEVEPERVADAEADPFASPSATDRALQDLHAQRAESEQRVSELRLARQESEARVRALRTERHAADQGASKAQLADEETRLRVSAAPQSDVELSTDADENEIAPAASKPSIWKRMMNRIQGRSGTE